jgi:hypothetical protein
MAPFQNSPFSASSGVAVAPPLMPKDWTSFTSSAYRSLVNDGGPPGRNWSACFKAKGVTFRQCVNCD